MQVLSFKLYVNYHIKVCFVVFCNDGKTFAQKELYPAEYIWK